MQASDYLNVPSIDSQDELPEVRLLADPRGQQLGDTPSVNGPAIQAQDESELRSFCKLYRMNLGVSLTHMLTYYFCVFITVSFLVFINVTAPFVLDNYLHVRKGEAGNVSGSLAFYNEIVIIAVSSLWGSLSDKLGRRWVWTAGFYVMGLGFYLYPLATSFWELFLFRVVYAVGAAASSAMITAVLGDYVLYHDRGKASGLVGFVAGCGAVFAVFVYMKIPYWVAARSELSSADCGRVMFFIVVIISAISTVVAMLGLQPRWKARSHQPHATLSQILREGLLAARKPIVALSYAAGFGARGDSVIITLFLSLWVTQEALRLGYSQPAAAYAAGTISGIAQTCALLFAPFAGFLVDKVNRVLSLAVLSSIGACGYMLVFLYTRAIDWPLILGVCLVGCGEIGLIVSSTSLVAQESPPEIRGSVAGFFGICGSIGILFATKLGGILYDVWRPGAPFLIFGIYNVILAVSSLLLWLTHEERAWGNKRPQLPASALQT